MIKWRQFLNCIMINILKSKWKNILKGNFNQIKLAPIKINLVNTEIYINILLNYLLQK